VTESPLRVRRVTESDAAAVAAIYNHYVQHSVVTFEEEPVAPAEMARRIQAVAAASLPWLVAEEDGHVRAYSYATRWKERSAYRFSVEITLYVAHDHPRRGIGSLLYSELFPALEARGVHVALAGIALPNDASVAIHERFGMRKVAHLEEVGFKRGRWVDVGYWQRTLAAESVWGAAGDRR
jgi:phosphinothricin acetyltransferase